MERKELFEWAKEIYGAEPDYPWSDWNCVLRHKNNKKWFALVVEFNARKLGLAEDKTVDVLNIKCDPMMIGSLRMKEGFFPAYYISDDDSIQVGDFVIVPAGKDNHEAVVEVVKKEYFTEEDVPLPMEKTKHIIRKCTEDDFDLRDRRKFCVIDVPRQYENL